MQLLVPFAWVTGMAIAVTLTAYALFGSPPEEAPATRPPLWRLLALSAMLFIPLWPIAYAIAEIGGWMFIWGDNTHPGQNYVIHFACAVSGAIAAAPAIRLGLGCAQPIYARTLMWLAASLLTVEAVPVLTHPDVLPTLLTFSPIIIAIASWLGIYRRQVQERRLSLGSVFALMCAFAIGLALTVYIRG